MKTFSRLFVAVASAGALTLTAVPAAQASSTGWRIVKVYGESAQYPSLQGDTASAADDAWAVGTTTQSLVVDHWNGATWQSVKPPKGFAGLVNKSVNDFVVADTSATDMWTFPNLSGPKASPNYALYWNGSTWTSYKLTGTQSEVFAAAVFSPTDVWAFGQKPSSGTGAGYGPPWAVHFNGTSWQQVSMPGTALEVSPISATDMWALGPNLATAGKTNQTYIAMHGDGTSWQSVKIPKLVPVQAGYPWIPNGIVATSDNDVWVSEQVASHGGEPGPNGLALVQWNGTSWTKVAENRSMHFNGGLASDGSGGFWLSGDESNFYIVHYSDGNWTRQIAPAKPGYSDGVGSFAAIPGTTSTLALGGMLSTGSDPDESAILKYSP
jgi:hypothetical protein